MNGVERIQAAIDKLTAETGASTPGSWVHGQNDPSYSVVFSADYRELAHIGITPDDGVLIVTLRRTTEPQLDILREALRQASDPLFAFPFTAYDRAAIALADKILGNS